MKNIIVFLTVRPLLEFYNFCKQLQNEHYSIYICIDDNTYEIPQYDGDINIIKIDNNECERNGFKDCVLLFRHRCCSRDKALYYFCKNDIEYDNIWFIEEDVFIPTIKTISNIDNKYGNVDDLLVTSHDVQYDTNFNGWMWPHIGNSIALPLPWASSMICAIRVSKKMMDSINTYAKKYKTLFMDEALFNTLAIHNNLKVNTILELSTISYKSGWTISDININYLYHPVKNINAQTIFRKIIEMNIFDKSKNFVEIVEEIYLKHISLTNILPISEKTCFDMNFADPLKKILVKMDVCDDINIIVHYGIDNNKIEVTQKFIANFNKNNKIIIPGTTSFNNFFGDPCHGYRKKIFLRINNIHIIIEESNTLKDLELDICKNTDCITNNITIYYELNNVQIDVTDNFIYDFDKNKKIIIPNIDHNSYIKKTFLKINNTKHMVNGNNISKYLNLQQYSDMQKNTISAKYGTDNCKIDVSDIFVNKFKINNKIIIPKNTSFNLCFGDPHFGHIKKVFLKIHNDSNKQSKYMINEDIISTDLEFDI